MVCGCLCFGKKRVDGSQNDERSAKSKQPGGAPPLYNALPIAAPSDAAPGVSQAKEADDGIRSQREEYREELERRLSQKSLAKHLLERQPSSRNQLSRQHNLHVSSGVMGFCHHVAASGLPEVWHDGCSAWYVGKSGVTCQGVAGHSPPCAYQGDYIGPFLITPRYPCLPCVSSPVKIIRGRIKCAKRSAMAT